MRKFLIAIGMTVALSACDDRDSEVSNELNSLTVQDLNIVESSSEELAGNAVTNDLIVEDLTTNRPDTNPANGL